MNRNRQLTPRESYLHGAATLPSTGSNRRGPARAGACSAGHRPTRPTFEHIEDEASVHGGCETDVDALWEERSGLNGRPQSEPLIPLVKEQRVGVSHPDGSHDP